jgi:hypothetical protein
MVGVIGVATGGDGSRTASPGNTENLDDHLHGAGAGSYAVRQRAGCSPSVTCTRRWATAGLHQVEVAARSTSASGCSGKQARWPVTELDPSWLPHDGRGVRRVLRLVSGGRTPARRRVGLSMEDAFVFLSVACDVR